MSTAASVRWGSAGDAPDDDQQSADSIPDQPTLTLDQLAEYAGDFYAPELDATDRFAVVDTGLELRPF